MVIVAHDARTQGDRARLSQALTERLRGDSERLSAFTASISLQSLTSNEPVSAELPRMTVAGLQVFGELSTTLDRLSPLLPAARSNQLNRDVSSIYSVGMALLPKVTSSPRLNLARSNRVFQPHLDRLDRDIAAATTAQARAADAANRRASVAFAGALGGGLLALLVLTLGLARQRRRLHAAENAREVERRSDERIRALVEHSSDVVVVVGPKFDIRWTAASIERLLGVPAREMIGSPALASVHRDDLVHVERAFGRSLRGEGVQTVSGRLQHSEGRWIDIEAVVENRLDDPAVQGLLVSMRDVGERKALEDRLRYQAFHDRLTGLANRALFEERLAVALRDAKAAGHKAAVLFLDLDDFKTINDSLGHAFGDELLRTAATRIAGALRAGDVASRLGGDEFAVLLARVDDERAAVAAAERVLSALRPEFEVAGRPLSVNASIGIVLEDGGSADVAAVLRNADIAMYGAKEQGKGSVRVFEEELHQRVLDRLELSAELPAAIETEQLVLEFQPIVELETERVSGVEALVRWEHPTRGRLSPFHFIGLAEETGLIVPLGVWVLRTACREVRALQLATGRDDLYLSVNVSTKQLRDPGFPDRVAEALTETGLAPATLVLELTESLLVHDRDEILAHLNRLKRLGLRLAVDDFGTGYSVLSYLQKFPIDVLKIDKCFVDEIHTQPARARLVAGIVNLSKSLELQVVAEGIEEAAQAAELRAMQSMFGQGFLYSRPVPSAAITELLLAARTTVGASDAA